MKLAIIAAGEGSRLQSEGISTPKPLIKINGIPMIDRIINIASENNIKEVFCIVNEYSESVRQHLIETKYKIPVTVHVKTTPSSLHSLYELSGYAHEQFLLATADTVFSDKDFKRFIEYINSNSDFDVLLSVTGIFEDDKPLCVELDEEDRITSFHNERDNHQWATGGIYYFRVNIKNELEYAVNKGMQRLRRFFGMLLEKGIKMKVQKFERIIDVDHAADIADAEDFLNTTHNQNRVL